MTTPSLRTEVREPARAIPVHGAWDVVVLGGGPAGLAAAASAAMNGASVLLVERYGFLGGMGTAAGVTNFCGLHANVHGEIRQVVHGVADLLLARMRALDGLNQPHLVLGRIWAQAYDMAALKCAADGLLADAGVDLLFHALGAGITKSENGDIESLLLETRSGRVAVLAKVFIDCSGDADIAHWSGVAYEKGSGAGAMMYPTLMFKVGNVDAALAGDAWRSIPATMEALQAAGQYRFPRHGAIVRPMKNDYEWRVNVTQLAGPDGAALDGTDAVSLSAGEIEGRRQAVDYLRFLREQIPGFANAYLLDIPPQLGIRETRRIVAEAMLGAEHVLGCARFDDSIGVNGWPLEKHVAGNVLWEWPPIPESCGYNQLPFRMLLPRRSPGGPANLLVAGRCAGMTHDGQSAARVSGACFVMGEAAGAAAALALAGNGSVYGVESGRLQQALLRQGAFLG